MLLLAMPARRRSDEETGEKGGKMTQAPKMYFTTDQRPWYKRLKPNLPASTSDKAYAEAWMRLLVMRWGESEAREAGKPNA